MWVGEKDGELKKEAWVKQELDLRHAADIDQKKKSAFRRIWIKTAGEEIESYVLNILSP